MARGDRPNVLVVEDSPAVRLSVAGYLEGRGCNVTEAENGRVGIRALGRCNFDLIVTDVLMPEVDGIELIKAARTLQPEVKILAMSGGAPNMPAGYLLKMTRMFNADEIIYKPFLNEELGAAVDRLLDRPL
ncbi:regulator [Azospirillum thiophilum]|uniref:Regulator n=1 Tax=Azospirillum thiophilum TaxID=528244 RepID=A0AAC8ZTV3_9PROT|nr:response regulator [Azospirillum thiophilum]ALG71335.1 regulator [Azospirillum thiophilum]KJR65010.1 regulator [Azospirillum thiophilum]